ncbi:MAG: hypothetical protein JWQ58_1408 [Reyranella sp.]|nr:hypothetical protein [Reyranella sp.]
MPQNAIRDATTASPYFRGACHATEDISFTGRSRTGDINVPHARGNAD